MYIVCDLYMLLSRRDGGIEQQFRQKCTKSVPVNDPSPFSGLVK